MTDVELRLLDYLSSYAQRRAVWRDLRLDAKLRVFCDLAVRLSTLSTCKRLSVGCVILPLDLSSVSAIGYNGVPAGEDNSSCDGEEGRCPCIHAEANALVKLRDRRDCLLLTTVSPCLHCAGLIVNSGVVRAVGYLSEYRDLSGLTRLQAAKIVTVQL
jgi:deoxycytidylate deaminase